MVKSKKAYPFWQKNMRTSSIQLQKQVVNLVPPGHTVDAEQHYSSTQKFVPKVNVLSHSKHSLDSGRVLVRWLLVRKSLQE